MVITTFVVSLFTLGISVWNLVASIKDREVEEEAEV